MLPFVSSSIAFILHIILWAIKEINLRIIFALKVRRYIAYFELTLPRYFLLHKLLRMMFIWREKFCLQSIQTVNLCRCHTGDAISSSLLFQCRLMFYSFLFLSTLFLLLRIKVKLHNLKPLRILLVWNHV